MGSRVLERLSCGVLGRSFLYSLEGTSPGTIVHASFRGLLSSCSSLVYRLLSLRRVSRRLPRSPRPLSSLSFALSPPW